MNWHEKLRKWIDEHPEPPMNFADYSGSMSMGVIKQAEDQARALADHVDLTIFRYKEENDA